MALLYTASWRPSRPRPWNRRATTDPSAAAFLHSFLHSFFAGFDGRFDVGPLFRNEALSAFNRLVKRRTRFLGFLNQVFLRLPGIGLQFSARLFSGLWRKKNPGKSTGRGSCKECVEKRRSRTLCVLIIHARPPGK